MTPTRADLERLIERWRKEADDCERTIGWHDSVCARLDKASDELAALLTSEGPSQPKSQVAPISLASHVAGLGLDEEE